MSFPCGKCRWCKIAKSREWALRVMHELPYHKNSVFATLTYRDEDLPPDASLSKQVLQNFLKRLREVYNGTQIKYFACGEYGDPQNCGESDPNRFRWLARRFSRPHYHLILFGPSLDDHSLVLVNPSRTEDGWKCINGPIVEAWGYGYVVLGTVTCHSVRYCMDYMHKSFTKEVNELTYGRCLPPFQLQSKGLGKQYALEYSSQILRDLSCTYRGVKVGLPRYYSKLLVAPSAIHSNRLHTKSREATYATRHRLASTKGLNLGWQQNSAMREELIQAGKNALAKFKTKGSKL